LPFKILIEADRIVFKAVESTYGHSILPEGRSAYSGCTVGCEKDQPASCVAFNSTILIAVWTM